MKNFKLFRTGSLILGLWSLISTFYIIISDFEKSDCCSIETEGYGFYTLVQWIIDAKGDLALEACHCDGKNLPMTFWIIPVDLIVSSLVFLGIFVYFQFLKRAKKETGEILEQ